MGGYDEVAENDAADWILVERKREGNGLHGRRRPTIRRKRYSRPEHRELAFRARRISFYFRPNLRSAFCGGKFSPLPLLVFVDECVRYTREAGWNIAKGGFLRGRDAA